MGLQPGRQSSTREEEQQEAHDGELRTRGAADHLQNPCPRARRPDSDTFSIFFTQPHRSARKSHEWSKKRSADGKRPPNDGWRNSNRPGPGGGGGGRGRRGLQTPTTDTGMCRRSLQSGPCGCTKTGPSHPTAPKTGGRWLFGGCSCAAGLPRRRPPRARDFMGHGPAAVAEGRPRLGAVWGACSPCILRCRGRDCQSGGRGGGREGGMRGGAGGVPFIAAAAARRDGGAQQRGTRASEGFSCETVPTASTKKDILFYTVKEVRGRVSGRPPGGRYAGSSSRSSAATAGAVMRVPGTAWHATPSCSSWARAAGESAVPPSAA